MKALSRLKAVSFFSACTLAISCTLASADSIQLRNGRHLQGKFIGGSTTTIGFMTTHSVEYFQTTDVLALIFDNNTGENNPEPSTNRLQPNPRDSTSAVMSPIDDRLSLNPKSASGKEIAAEARERTAAFRCILE